MSSLDDLNELETWRCFFASCHVGLNHFSQQVPQLCGSRGWWGKRGVVFIQTPISDVHLNVFLHGEHQVGFYGYVDHTHVI